MNLRTDFHGRRAACLAALAGAGALTLAGCEKPKPPPPPPPPPADPTPVAQDVNFDTLLQELKADARVQFAKAATITDERLDLAKGIVHLADDIARGDGKGLRTLLTRNAQGVLEDLQSSGAWEEAAKRIEAVRVVSIQQGVSIPGHANATGVVLAVQEPDGAYLLSWAAEHAGDTWVFANAPAPADVRPRASAWDGVGPEAFQGMKLAVVEEAKPAAKKEGDEEDKKEDAPPPPPTGGKGKGGGRTGG